MIGQEMKRRSPHLRLNADNITVDQLMKKLVVLADVGDNWTGLRGVFLVYRLVEDTVVLVSALVGSVSGTQCRLR